VGLDLRPGQGVPQAGSTSFGAGAYTASPLMVGVEPGVPVPQDLSTLKDPSQNTPGRGRSQIPSQAPPRSSSAFYQGPVQARSRSSSRERSSHSGSRRGPSPREGMIDRTTPVFEGQASSPALQVRSRQSSQISSSRGSQAPPDFSPYEGMMMDLTTPRFASQANTPAPQAGQGASQGSSRQASQTSRPASRPSSGQASRRASKPEL